MAAKTSVASSKRPLSKYYQFIKFAYAIGDDKRPEEIKKFFTSEPSKIFSLNEIPEELRAGFGNGASWARQNVQNGKRILIKTFDKNMCERGGSTPLLSTTSSSSSSSAIHYIQAVPASPSPNETDGEEDFPTSLTRSIRDDICKEIKLRSCVVCGTNSEIQVDHKNDLYNDPRVLCIKTQSINDFQALCRHCNCQKRQVSKVTRKTGKRYGATNIPHLSAFGIDFTKGDENFDAKDVNAMVGTFWYDPVEFMIQLKQRIVEEKQ